jgi:predicted regulator of Ras-like GTPase activity (Roadblock/LC7/MglB family)
MIARRSGFAVAFAFAGLVLVSSLAWAAEFSADLVTTGGPAPTKSTIYIKGQSLRHEMTQGKQQVIVILNADKKMMWMVTPATKSYLGQAVPAAKLKEMVEGMRGRMPTGAAAKGFKIKQLGSEKISGYPCEKSQAEGQGMKITIWYSKKLELALRTDMSGTMGGKKMTTRQEVKNIKERKLGAALFAPPKGYKPMEMPKGPAGAPGATRQGGARGGK